MHFSLGNEWKKCNELIQKSPSARPIPSSPFLFIHWQIAIIYARSWNRSRQQWIVLQGSINKFVSICLPDSLIQTFVGQILRTSIGEHIKVPRSNKIIRSFGIFYCPTLSPRLTIVLLWPKLMQNSSSIFKVANKYWIKEI